MVYDKVVSHVTSAKQTDRSDHVFYRIGEFARICQVTRQTLRHWDSIGLLRPAHINKSNLYRYYTIAQIVDVNRIMALQTIGLTLNEIQALSSNNQWQAMFENKLRFLDDTIQQVQAQREMLATHIESMTLDEPLDLEIVVKEVDEQVFYLLPDSFSSKATVYKALAELQSYQEDSEILLIALSTASDRYDDIFRDVRVGFLAIKPNGRFQLQKQLDLRKYQFDDDTIAASKIFRGHLSESDAIDCQIRRWATAHSYQISGQCLMIYHHLDKDDGITEFQYPIQKEKE